MGIVPGKKTFLFKFWVEDQADSAAPYKYHLDFSFKVN
jgi:hypothetical protein